MAADPTPKDAALYLRAQRTVMQTNADRPVLLELLEMERGMTRVSHQQLVVGFCELLDLRGKLTKQEPEIWTGKVIQNFVLLP